MPSKRKAPVLIVGGGPIGLALAAELGWRGIGCELVEQTDGVVAIPKMNEVNTRTMEFCRRWGVADAVRNCPFPADFPMDAAFVTSLFGYELGRVPRPARASQKPESYSPMRAQVCSQHWFDPILQNLARSFAGTRLRYRHRLKAFEQSPSHVLAHVENLATGEALTIEAEYLVACDGAGSMVRRALGIEMVGQGTIGHPLHMFFRAPNLLEDAGRAKATFFLLADRGGFWGNLRVIDPIDGMWRLMVDETDGNATEEGLIASGQRDAYLRRALGRDYPVEWLQTSIWKRRSSVAERYSEGRVFLAGDAVHQLSPTGAMGMNTGIGDAVDLGWKLDAMLRGWGGAGLLASYDSERRPVGDRAVRMATGFYRNNSAFARALDRIDAENAEGAKLRAELGRDLVNEVGKEFRTIGLQLGYAYEGSPLVAGEGAPPPADLAETYMPSARPGARAPHGWLKDGRSVFDLFGRSFVLLDFSGADARALSTAAAKRGVPLDIIALDEPSLRELYGRDLVLVRPDGHVAWRGDILPADPLALIDRIRGA